MKSGTSITAIIYGLILLFTVTACNRDEKIEKLLRSDSKEDVIEGAVKAGETRDKKFVPLLLKNAAARGRSINLWYLGISEYQSKMWALEKIYNQKPPVEITRVPDSTVIKFYIKLSEEPQR